MRTAMLSALVVVLDYGLEFSDLRIPFPWLPILKFDFTGVPVALSFALQAPRATFLYYLACLYRLISLYFGSSFILAPTYT